MKQEGPRENRVACQPKSALLCQLSISRTNRQRRREVPGKVNQNDGREDARPGFVSGFERIVQGACCKHGPFITAIRMLRPFITRPRVTPVNKACPLCSLHKWEHEARGNKQESSSNHLGQVWALRRGPGSCGKQLSPRDSPLEGHSAHTSPKGRVGI